MCGRSGGVYLDRFIGKGDGLTGDFEALLNGEGGGIFGAADESGILDAVHAGGTVGFFVEPVGLADGRLGRKRFVVGRGGKGVGLEVGNQRRVGCAQDGIAITDPPHGNGGMSNNSMKERHHFAGDNLGLGGGRFDREAEAIGDEAVEVALLFGDDGVVGEDGDFGFDGQEGGDAGGGVFGVKGGESVVGELGDFGATCSDARPGGVDAVHDVGGWPGAPSKSWKDSCARTPLGRRVRHRRRHPHCRSLGIYAWRGFGRRWRHRFD